MSIKIKSNKLKWLGLCILKVVTDSAGILTAPFITFAIEDKILGNGLFIETALREKPLACALVVAGASTCAIGMKNPAHGILGHAPFSNGP